MSFYTKQALANALKDMLCTKSLDRITVIDLVEACNLSRQTFYYHFQDIYDLLGWIYKTEALAAIHDSRSYETWKQGIVIILEYMEGNRELCINTYRSLGKEHLEKFLNEVLNNFIGDVIDEIIDGHIIMEEDKKFIVGFYSHAFTGILLEWIRDGLKTDSITMVNHIEQLMEGQFVGVVQKFDTSND